MKAAYRALANIHHPDKGGDGSMMSRVNMAHDLLKVLPDAPSTPGLPAWTGAAAAGARSAGQDHEDDEDDDGWS